MVHRFDGRIRTQAALLAGLAGYVDALGFLTLGGFFVSFMSGNSTLLAVGMAQRSAGAATAGGLIALFVLGVVAGSLVGRFAGARRRAAVLGLMAALLATAAVLGGMAPGWIAAAPMTMAMGAENALFEQDGEVQIGLTYMTGTLVKVGQRLAGALTGGPRWAWAPHLMLWAGLVAGAVLGALAHAAMGLSALWFAAVGAGVAALAALRR